MSDALDKLRHRDRVRHGVRQSDNWWQLARFTAVGASGYVVNLIAFAICVHALGIDFRIASVIAFLIAVSNNFWWNRHWTFGAREGHAGHQALRFFVVSGASFGVNFAILELLVIEVGLKEVIGQAIAVAAATPVNFIGNKLWTFDE